MTKFGFCAITAVAALAACSAQTDENKANTVVPSAETRNAANAPLSRDQALALMKQRHDNMEALGDATKAINNELKSSSPDVAVIRKSADEIAKLAPELHGWFPEGTGPDVGKTRAKAEIWQKPEDFTQKANAFRQAEQQFQAAVHSGDVGKIQGAFADLGKTCKACHDPYRSPEEDH
jgi:cytochrome c556